MFSLKTRLLTFLRALPRAILLVLAISAPILSMSNVRASQSTTIEAPSPKKTGMGFVLMVSLQRT